LIEAWIDDGWQAWTGRGVQPSPSDYLLPRPDGEAWRPRSAEMLREHLRLLCIKPPPETTLHRLRAFFATELERTGASDTTRARLMGHRGKSTAAIHYTGEMLEADRAAIARIPLKITKGSVPNGVPKADARHTAVPDLAEILEPPSRLELETYGLRNPYEGGRLVR